MLRRTILGIDRDDFLAPDRVSASIGCSARRCARFVGEGLLEDDGARVRFSREGRFLADRVLCELV